MAQLINLRLSRPDQSSPWGFRLQGGKDFGTPLLIQKVNFGSLSEKAGLQVGDALVRVNNQDVYDVKHKDAQDVILRSGNAFEITVQRGGVSTWKPSVTPIGPSPVPNRLSQSPQLVTKTSLARVGPSQSPAFGSGHNSVPKAFTGTQSPKVNGSGYGNETVKAIVNKQYNTPVGIYSEQNIAETLTAQAEVLAGGVIGVNFKKNEKNYEANNSEVFKMVQEADKEPKDHHSESEVNHSHVIDSVSKMGGMRHVNAPEQKAPQSTSNQNICADCERLIVLWGDTIVYDLHEKFAYFSAASHAIGGRATSPRPQTPVHMPEQRDPYLGSPLKEIDNHVDSTQPIVECSECRKDIIGVFVRIKEKNLHVECFKCATCGSSLKNVGYYNINNKLYCDIHAKMMAKQNPPAPNLDPVTVPPGSHPPMNSFNIIPNKPLGVQSPQPSTLSPIPFHAPKSPGHVNAPKASRPQPQPNIVPTINRPYDAPKPTQTLSNYNSGYNQVTTGGGQPSTRSTGSAGLTAPRRGRGVLNPQNLAPGARVPLCGNCNLYISQRTAGIEKLKLNGKGCGGSDNEDATDGHFMPKIVPNPECNCCHTRISRGPFITALGKIWCPEHFVCANDKCRRPLQDIGFVEEDNGLYCEYCFEQYLAPICSKCSNKIKGDCLNAIGKQFHPECFNCTYCGKLFGNSPFFLEDSLPYCENDWNELFTTKCIACGFPIEAGDRWVEALNNNYHSPCFNCSKCKTNLEGQSFYAKGGRPYCKSHAR